MNQTSNVRLSSHERYLEIYKDCLRAEPSFFLNGKVAEQEQITDLLEPSSTNLQIREDIRLLNTLSW